MQSWETLTSTAPSQLFAEAPAEDGFEPGSPLRPTLRRDTSVLQSMMMSTGNLVRMAKGNASVTQQKSLYYPTQNRLHSSIDTVQPIKDNIMLSISTR